MLVDETVKVELEIRDLGKTLVADLKKAESGEKVLQILGESLTQLGTLVKDASAVASDFQESCIASLRALALTVAESAAVLLKKDGEPL